MAGSVNKVIIVDEYQRGASLPHAMRKNRDVIGATNALKAQLQQKEAA